jgi:2-polyprenyl-3-methyl-5-hydroxy-6-metoxy-1,4-benzoquinol methylase
VEFKKCREKRASEETACPGCARPVTEVRYSYLDDGRQSFIYGCPHCGLMFARPVLIPELSGRQMDSVEDAELFNSALLRALHEHLNINREILAVTKVAGRSDFSLLDIGCGTGWTTNVWQRAGVEVTGLEPSQVRGDLARTKYGFRVIRCYIEELENSEMFDVVTMRHVLEHFEDPFAVLGKVAPHLRDAGLLVIVVPNINCIGRYLFESKWSWVLPWHCSFFSPASLTTLLDRAGFDVVKRYQTPSPLWYPEAFSRRFPRLTAISRMFNRFVAISLVVFAPVIALGYLTGFSDNITMIARVRKSGKGAV